MRSAARILHEEANDIEAPRRSGGVGMDTIFQYALTLISAYPAWIGVNVVTPIALPLLGAVFVALLTRRSLVTALLDTFRFGQLGWVAIAWICSAMFDGWQQTSSFNTREGGFGWIFVYGVLASAFGPLIAVFCTETENRSKRHAFAACCTVCVTLLSAAALTYTHHQLVTKEFYAEGRIPPIS